MGMPRQLVASLVTAVGAAVVCATVGNGAADLGGGVLLVVALAVFARAAIQLASDAGRGRSARNRS